ncbi:MAG: hypothetical protein R2856_25750 [Caldilineaceae bacterium]
MSSAFFVFAAAGFVLRPLLLRFSGDSVTRRLGGRKGGRAGGVCPGDGSGGGGVSPTHTRWPGSTRLLCRLMLAISS